MDDLVALRDKVAISCNILALEGHWDNILGHVSARIPGENAMLMKPHSYGFEEIRPYHIIKVDFDGNKTEGEYERHSEVFIHTEIYRARPDVNCVIHSHPPYATAFASLRQRLRPVSHEGSIFHDGLPLFDYTTILIRTPELGIELARKLEGYRAVLMKNHGSTVVARIGGDRHPVRHLSGEGMPHPAPRQRLGRSHLEQRRGGAREVRPDLYTTSTGQHVGLFRAAGQTARHRLKGACTGGKRMAEKLHLTLACGGLREYPRPQGRRDQAGRHRADRADGHGLVHTTLARVAASVSSTSPNNRARPTCWPRTAARRTT